ncbi:MAG: hypothetical protein P9M14_18525 [Candidatus Alcyoniella australis]|nr:hypothetical protein [Candidatus Alcyoniella australis]
MSSTTKNRSRRILPRPGRLLRLLLISVIIVGMLLMVSVMLPFDWVLQAYLWYKDGIIERDTDNNGVVDYLETWSNGELISSQWDTDNDGRFDTFATYQDDKVVIFEIDFNRDGRIDYREYRDDRGDARYQIDKDYDGVFETDEGSLQSDALDLGGLALPRTGDLLQ